jgi:hypothetical protein
MTTKITKEDIYPMMLKIAKYKIATIMLAKAAKELLKNNSK